MDEVGITLHRGKKRQPSVHLSSSSDAPNRLPLENFNYLCQIVDEKRKSSMHSVYQESIKSILDYMKVEKDSEYLKTLFINANGLELEFLIDCIQDFYNERQGIRRAATRSITCRNFPITLAFFGHTSFTMLYQRIDRNVYSHLNVNYIEFPSAESFLNVFITQLFVPTDRSQQLRVQFSGELLKKIRDDYSLEDFSVPKLIHVLRFVLMDFCKSSTDQLKDLQNWHAFEENCRIYYKVLKCLGYFYRPLLHEEISEDDMKSGSFWALHHSIQKTGFISIKRKTSSEWRSLWNNWNRKEWNEKLNFLVQECSADILLREYAIKFQELMNQLDNLDSRMNDMAIISPEKAVNSKKKKEMSMAEYQRTRQVELKDKCSAVANPFKRDRQEIICFLDEFFSKWLVRFDELDPSFVVKYPVEIERGTRYEQLDLCVAYRCLHSLSEGSKTIPLVRFVEEFRSRLKNTRIDEEIVDIESRLFSCIGQLEFMGILKCASSDASGMAAQPNSQELVEEVRTPSTGSDSDLEIIENVIIEENSNSSENESSNLIKSQNAHETTEEIVLSSEDLKASLEKQESSTDEVNSKDSNISLATTQDQLEDTDSELESQEEMDANKLDVTQPDQKNEDEPLLSDEEARTFPKQILTEEEEELLYGQEARYDAIGNLIFFSVLIFTVPLAMMYVVYRILIDNYNWPPDDASFWAGMSAIGVVVIIVAIFVWIAYKEEHDGEERLKALKKNE